MNTAVRVAATVVAVCCGVIAQFSIAAAADASDRVIEPYIRQLAVPLGVEVQHTLDRMDDTARQLLALRSYLRAGDSLTARWSWTAAQITTYKQSQQYRDMQAEIGKITTRFEAANPGFTLYANGEVRSLDEQIAKWNSNASVGKVAGHLLRAARDQLALSAGASAAARPGQLSEFLLAWQPATPAPLAAPGLSLHGRGRALDFQVQQGNRIVAGTDISTARTVWVGRGWAQKLAAAIAGSGKFNGPLTTPDEPWHFEYRH